MQFWDNSTTKMSPFFGRVNDYDRLYHVKLPKDLEAEFNNIDDRSALVPPDVHNNLRSIKAQVKELLFADKPYGKVSFAGQPNKRNEVIDKQETKLSSMIDVSKFKHESDEVNDQIFKAGISACMTEWHTQYRRVPLLDPKTNLPKLDSAKNIRWEYQPVSSYPRCIGIDIRRMRIDDKAENRRDIRIMGYHVKQNLSDLLMLNEDPTNSIKFEKKELENSAFDYHKYYEFTLDDIPADQRPDQEKSPYGDVPVEVIEIRGQFRVDNEFKDLIVKIGNRSVLLEARNNDLPVPGWETFDLGSIDNEFNRIFTMGLVEPVEDLAIEQFIKRNQSLDISNHQAYPMYIADLAATADMPDQIEHIGGSIVTVNLAASGATGVDSVFKPIPHAANPVDTFQQSKDLKQDIQQTMAQNDYTQGNDPSRKETATAVNSLEQAGVRDIKQIVDNLARSYIQPVWQKFLIYQAFFAGHVQETITSEDGKDLVIKPMDWQRAFEVTIDVNSSLDRPLAVRRIVESAPIWINSPLVDSYQFMKTYGWYLKMPNLDKILPTPEVKIADVERENLALKQGVVQPVHEQDDHAFHIKIHMERGTADSKDPNFQMSEKAIVAYDEHVKTHQGFLEQEGNTGVGNVTNLKDGPNQGQLIGGSNPQGTTPG